MKRGRKRHRALTLFLLGLMIHTPSSEKSEPSTQREGTTSKKGKPSRENESEEIYEREQEQKNLHKMRIGLESRRFYFYFCEAGKHICMRVKKTRTR